jgi:PKD repeat protein/Zn-dependent protease
MKEWILAYTKVVLLLGIFIWLITPSAAFPVTLSGHVYQGNLGDTSIPSTGIDVKIYQSDNPSEALSENLITSTTTNTLGFYQLTFDYNPEQFGKPYYHIWIGIPSGFVYQGGQSTGGIVGGMGIYYKAPLNDKVWTDNNFWVIQPIPPNASFSVNTVSGDVPLSITFTDTSTGNPSSWFWEFGDGSSSPERVITHTYQLQGTYTARLTVSNQWGSRSNTQIITVSGGASNILHTDFVASPLSGKAPLTVQFTDTSTGDPIYWNWDLDNDGHVIESSERNPTYTYNTPGIYSVRLWTNNQVNKPDEEIKYNYITVLSGVSENPPHAEFSANPLAGPAPLDVNFDGRNSHSIAGSIKVYFWEFGDGSSGSESVVRHSYTSPGDYHVSLIVTDEQGRISEPTSTSIQVMEPVTPIPTTIQTQLPTTTPTPLPGTIKPEFSPLLTTIPSTILGSDLDLMQFVSMQHIKFIFAIFLGIGITLLYGPLSQWYILQSLCRLKNEIKDYLSSTLENLFEQFEFDKRKIKPVSPGKPIFLGFSSKELGVIVLSVGIFTLALLFISRLQIVLVTFVTFLVMGGCATLLHEIGHRFMAHHFGRKTELQFWGLGSAVLLISALFLGFIFSMPSLNVFKDNPSVDKREIALIMMSGPMMNLVFVIICFFFIKLNEGFIQWASAGITLNLVAGTFTLIPFAPMDGKDLFQWKKLVWFAVFGPVFAIYIAHFLGMI